MKSQAFAALFFFWGISSATFGQESHLTNEVEISLDDFPGMTAGYGIQIGTFSLEKMALELKHSLQEKFEQKANLHFEDGLWRIRLGNFSDTLACRAFLDSLIVPAGHEDAFLVADRIPVARDSQFVVLGEPGFRVQIAAFANRDSAVERAKNMACNFPDLRAHVMKADSLYKVQFGDFRLQGEAEAWKIELEQVDSMQAIVVPAQVYGPPPPSPNQKTPDEDIFKYDD
jgi:hypothetical protein